MILVSDTPLPPSSVAGEGNCPPAPRLRFRAAVASSVILLALCAHTLPAADGIPEIDALRREFEQLRKQANARAGANESHAVDRAIAGKYGPGAPATAKSGKLLIGGSIQIWYYSIANDNKGLFNDPAISGNTDTNEGADNDSFRARRVDLKFTMDVHENVTAVVQLHPVRENINFLGFPVPTGALKRVNNPIALVQSGAGAKPRLLDDAYLNFHGVVPHHDFQVGQFKTPFGEEGMRSAAQIEFVDRALMNQVAGGSNRDLGATVHGLWWEERFQYWLGVYNGAGNFYQSSGQFQSRSDDNDEKDFYFRALVRPVWQQRTWGSLELGWSTAAGVKGEAAGADPVGNPNNGLNRNQNAALKHGAWAGYLPGGPVKGLWLRGEWAWLKDRHTPETVIDLNASDNDGDGLQDNGRPFSAEGWYVAAGYKISDSVFCDRAPGWLQPWEFALRYQEFENIHVADLIQNNHTDTFKTAVWTGGVSYFIKGYNARMQFNYNAVDEPAGRDNAGNRRFHEVSNDSVVVSFQIAF